MDACTGKVERFVSYSGFMLSPILEQLNFNFRILYSLSDLGMPCCILTSSMHLILQLMTIFNYENDCCHINFPEMPFFI